MLGKNVDKPKVLPEVELSVYFHTPYLLAPCFGSHRVKLWRKVCWHISQMLHLRRVNRDRVRVSLIVSLRDKKHFHTVTVVPTRADTFSELLESGLTVGSARNCEPLRVHSDLILAYGPGSRRPGLKNVKNTHAPKSSGNRPPR